MIQRIQTVFLLLGIAFTVAFFFVPFGYTPVMDESDGIGILHPLKAYEFVGLIVPSVVSILLMLGAIFTFKNYTLQKRLTLLAVVSLLAAIGVVIYALTCPWVDTNPDVTIAMVWGGGGLLLVAAVIANIAAYRYISKDQQLIRSYDRIR